MDPAIERLVLNPGCRTARGEFNPAGAGSEGRCIPDDAAFKRLINQFGFALAPNPMHSARTTGLGGFHLSVEAAYTKISDGEDYWEYGTQGTRGASDNQASIRNTDPQSFLQLYSLKFRKGFGFGVELAGVVGFMPKTSILSGGADLRISLLEGFRKGVGGMLPDVAVGSGIRTITGTPEFHLTTVGLDAQVSKPLPVADASVITPLIGYQYVFIFGDSGLVDFTPATDALGYCNYTGPNQPGNPDPNPAKGDYSGQPVCNGGSTADLNNINTFESVRVQRQRLFAGLNYRYEMVTVGAAFFWDIIPPEDAQREASDKEALAGESKQWTMAFEVGAMF